MALMDNYHKFDGLIIMEGKYYDDAKAELHRQIDMLLEWDSGLAQPCHCEFHDPVQCAKDTADDKRQREELANNIRLALRI